MGAHDFPSPLKADEAWSATDLAQAFETSYRRLVTDLRQRMGTRGLILAVQPSFDDNHANEAVPKIVDGLRAQGDQRRCYLRLPHLERTACDHHPSLTHNRLISDALVKFIQDLRTRFERRQTMPPPFVAVLLLPVGMSSGFVTVAMGYILAQHGVSVGVIASLVGLRLLPDTWSFLAGPLIDSTLSSASWYVLSVFALSVGIAGFGFVPLQSSSASLLGALCLTTGVSAVLSATAINSAIALTTLNEVRGACAGWRQTGFLGGIGLGGGVGLWLANHAGMQVSTVVLAVACLSCVWPFLILQVPKVPRGAGVVVAAREALGALLAQLRCRDGVLAIIAVTIPAGVGAAANLLPAVASDWKASANLVAIVTGIVGGLANIPGCIVAGYLCDRFARRTVFIWAAALCALGEALMALMPHTPWSFSVLVLTNNLLIGLAYGGVTAIIYDRLGPKGAATVGSVLSSMCNVPVVVVTMLIGAVQVRYGSSAMLLAEAGLGVMALT